MVLLLWLSALTDGTIRLRESNTPLTGRVEIFHSGQWGTVCSDSWDINDANIVCKQLGFRPATQAFGGASHGQGSGPIWMDDVACSGSESLLSECSHRGWGNSDCTHSKDASVQCSYGSSVVRLVNGGASYGRVEVNYSGSGKQFVMTPGTSMMPVLCAVSSGSPVPYRLLTGQHTVKVWILSGLMKSAVWEQRCLCLIALMSCINWAVNITKMQVLCVTLRWLAKHWVQ